jgi:hypothetical protein
MPETQIFKVNFFCFNSTYADVFFFNQATYSGIPVYEMYVWPGAN